MIRKLLLAGVLQLVAILGFADQTFNTPTSFEKGSSLTIRSGVPLKGIWNFSGTTVDFTGATVIGVSTGGGGGGGIWGSITGTLSDQSDLNVALSNKQAALPDLSALGSVTGTNTIYYRAGPALWNPVTFSGLTFNSGVLTAAGGTWASITGKPTTIAGFGITDAQPLDPDLTSLAGASATNTLYYRSAANTWTPVTITAPLTFSAGSLSSTAGGNGTVTTTGSPVTNSLALFSTATAITSGNLSGDVTTTGTLATTLTRLPSGVAQAGYVEATNIVAPANPAAGKVRIYGETTTGTLAVKTSTGAVTHTVKTSTPAPTLFSTGVDDTGTVTTAQPVFSDVGGVAINNQMPPIFTGKTIDNTNTIAVKDGSLTIQNTADTTKRAIFDLTNVGTGQIRTVNVPNANSTTVQPNAGGSNIFITGISAQGVVTGAQPAFSNVSGIAGNGQLPGLITNKTFDDTNVYTAKDGSFTLANATTPTKKAVFDLSNIGAATTRTINIPNANSTTVQPSTFASTQYVTGISAQGVVTQAQPTFSDVGGVTTNPQLPPAIDNTHSITVKSGGFVLQDTTDITKTTVFDLTGIATGQARSVKIPDGNSVTVKPGTFVSTQYMTGIDSAGTITRAQPTFSDVSGAATTAQMPAILSGKTLTGGSITGNSVIDDTNTITVKDGSLLLENTTNTGKKATFDLSNIVSPNTRVINVPNANSTTVQPSTFASTQYVTGISAQGVVTQAQPAFSDVSGAATNAQLPSTISGKAITGGSIAGGTTVGGATIDPTNTITIKDGTNFKIQNATTATKQAQFDLTNITAANTRTINIPDANSTTVQPTSLAASSYVTGISAQGVVTGSQPSFANVSGTLDLARTTGTIASTQIVGQIPSTQINGSIMSSQMPALTGDMTLDAGTTVTTLVNIPSGTTQAGYVIATATAAPVATPAGKGSIYVDSTSKNLAMKNDAGVVNHGVQTMAFAGTKYITAIADNGTVSSAQPSFVDVSGVATTGQIPTTLTNKTLSGGSITGGLAIDDTTKIQSATDATKVAKFDLTNIGTGSPVRTINVPNANSTTVQPTTLAGSGFVKGIDAQGLPVGSAVAFSDVSGAATSGQLPSTITGKTLSTSTLDNTNTLTVKAGNFSLQDTTDPTKQATFSLVNVGTGSPTKTINVPNADSTTVQPNTGSAKNYITGISATGLITTAQPLFSDLSGTATNSQIPATIDNTHSIQVKDNAFTLQNATDTTKTVTFDASKGSSGVPRTVTFPSVSSVTVAPSTAAAKSYITGVNRTGVLVYAQPSFLDLVDSPSVGDFVGQSLKGIRVNAGASGLEYYTPTTGTVTTTGSPSNARLAQFSGATSVTNVDNTSGAAAFVKLNADDSVTVETPSLFRTSLGATTVGGALFTVSTPGVKSWINITGGTGALNIVDAAQTRTDLSLNNVTNDAQIKASDFPASSTDSQLAVFNGTSGKSLKTATNNSANWDTGYSERRQWDGGSTNLTPTTGRRSLAIGDAEVYVNASIASQSFGAADTYITGSAVTIGTAGGWQVGGQYKCVFDMAKTAAGVAPFTISIRMGTAGTTADTAVHTFTSPTAQTANNDQGRFEVLVNIRSIGSTGWIMSTYNVTRLNGTAFGFFNSAIQSIPGVGIQSATFNTTTQTKIGISFNGGASFSGTTTIVQAEYMQ